MNSDGSDDTDRPSSGSAARPKPPVLVTGASGFIGINLLHVLTASGRAVVGLDDRPVPEPAVESLGRYGPVPVVEVADVRDADAMAEIVCRQRPEIVIHAAAVTAGGDRERRDARTVIEVNVGGTQSILDACAAAGVPRLLHVSSGAVYGPATFGTEPLDESMLVAPTFPPPSYYGITKLAAEQVALRHGQLHDVGVVVARLSAVFGPWEYPSGVRDFMSPMLQMVTAARDGTPIRLPADRPRNWAYAPDAARVLVALADIADPGHRCYNVCPETTSTATAFLDRLARHHADLDHELVDDPRRATIGFDADPRLPRAPVSGRRLVDELEQRGGDPLWTDPADSFDAFVRWAEANPSWLRAS